MTPGLLPEEIARPLSRATVTAALVVVLLLGFGLRVFQLGAEGLSEDELNKVRAAEQYRAHGLTSANGEHPLLMKALLTGSIVLCERWNEAAGPRLQISLESATRLPAVVLGALTSLLIFLVVAELLGPAAGLTAAALWAFDPQAVGFNRIAKEDSFFLFFFLLGGVFWLRGQRAAEEGRARPEKFYWLAAAAFGAMMASKYVPHLFAIPASYYWIFQAIPATRWRLGKVKWLAFFAVMTLAFLACNPTILLPATWHEMRVFAGERRIGHDSYEFLGTLNRNQMTLWLNGSPWYFYYVFMAVKLPPLTVVSFCVGLPLLFKKRLGDGRFFVLFWLFFWFFPFTVLGGKFTRYFTFALPAVLITAALGLHALAGWLGGLLERRGGGGFWKTWARTSPPVLAVLLSAFASVSAAPYYRLYTNALGGGEARAGTYFPHDEFYDGSLRDTVAALLPHARGGARVASETPELVTFYARRAGRGDLVSVSLSDPAAVRELSAGDLVLVARGRRYFSNEKTVARLRAASRPVVTVPLGGVPSAEVFLLDEASRAAVSGGDAR